MLTRHITPAENATASRVSEQFHPCRPRSRNVVFRNPPIIVLSLAAVLGFVVHADGCNSRAASGRNMTPGLAVAKVRPCSPQPPERTGWSISSPVLTHASTYRNTPPATITEQTATSRLTTRLGSVPRYPSRDISWFEHCCSRLLELFPPCPTRETLRRTNDPCSSIWAGAAGREDHNDISSQSPSGRL